MSWLPDLYFLTGTKIPLIFTCANDFADVKGEVGVMTRILGANFVRAPKENEFGFASTLIPTAADAGKGQTADYSRGNSYWYCVQSHSKLERVILGTSDKSCFITQFLRAYNRHGSSLSPSVPRLHDLIWNPSRRTGDPSKPEESAEKTSAPSILAPVEVQKEGETSSRGDRGTDAHDESVVSNERKTNSVHNFEKITIMQTLAPGDEEKLAISINAKDGQLNELEFSLSEGGDRLLVSTRGEADICILLLAPIERSSLIAKMHKKRKEIRISGVLK